MWFKHSMSIVQQLIPIYNTTVRVLLLLPLMWIPIGAMMRHKHATSRMEYDISKDNLMQKC